jgi:hypothetical protein
MVAPSADITLWTRYGTCAILYPSSLLLNNTVENANLSKGQQLGVNTELTLRNRLPPFARENVSFPILIEYIHPSEGYIIVRSEGNQQEPPREFNAGNDLATMMYLTTATRCMLLST